MSDPQCMAGSFSHPGCAATRLKEKIANLEGELILEKDHSWQLSNLLETTQQTSVAHRVRADQNFDSYERVKRSFTASEQRLKLFREQAQMPATDSALAAHELVCESLERWRNRADTLEAALRAVIADSGTRFSFAIVAARAALAPQPATVKA